ncbi:MAG TPA: membrane protein insertase YidC [Alphaproteobacteria bacterium]|nr:membrane protein insertase YidC [Alphaproteobacteria bacterium]
MKDVTPDTSQRRRLLLAVVLSGLILLGFDAVSYFGFGKHALGGWNAPQSVQGGSAKDAAMSQKGAEVSKNGAGMSQNDAQLSQNGAPVAPAAAAVPAMKEIVLANDVLHLGYNLVGGKLDTLTLNKFEAHLGQPGGVALLNGESGQPLSTWLDSGWQSVGGMQVPDAGAVWQQQGSIAQGSVAGTATMVFKNASGQTFERTLTLQPGSYLIDVVDRVWNTAQLPVTLRHYTRVNRTGGAEPNEHSSWVNYSGPMGVVVNADGKEIVHEGKFSDIKKETRTAAVAGDGGWWGITTQYFMTGILPVQGNGEVARDFRFVNNGGTDLYSANVQRDVTVPAGGQADVRYKIYAGPKQQELLEAAGQGMERAIDWGWFAVIAKPLHTLLLMLHGWLHSWGLAIFAITLLLKLATFPLANKSYRAMAKMKKLTPEITRLREQHAGDQQALALKTMELYSREKVNPMGGCWPTLIQIPIFFAMYKVVLVAFELRHAPLTSFWIHDLSVMDPYYVLPVLMGASMYVQMQLQPPAADPTQQMVFKWMPVMFTVMFLSFPAGLVFYWLCNNVLSVAQQYYMLRKDK